MANEKILVIEDNQDELERIKAKYYELIYAVERKFPNESRHETALKYIKQAENSKTQTASEANTVDAKKR